MNTHDDDNTNYDDTNYDNTIDDETDDEAGERSELDEELRRLFTDDRLTLPVAEGAGAAVVAGARRRRRNRVALAAAGGVLAVTAVVFAGTALSGVGHPGDTVGAAGRPVLTTTLGTGPLTTAPPATATPSVTAANPSPAVPVDVLGPYGFGALRLGMSIQQATAAGLVRVAGPVTSTGCVTYAVVPDAVSSVDAAASAAQSAAIRQKELSAKTAVQAEFSKRYGLVALTTTSRLWTPQGIGVGSSVKDLYTVYPGVTGTVVGRTVNVQVNGHPDASYEFYFDKTGTMTSFTLRLVRTDCAS